MTTKVIAAAAAVILFLGIILTGVTILVGHVTFDEVANLLDRSPLRPFVANGCHQICWNGISIKPWSFNLDFFWR